VVYPSIVSPNLIHFFILVILYGTGLTETEG
jgi:hypothetical protein